METKHKSLTECGIENLCHIAANYGGWKNPENPSHSELVGRFMFLRQEELKLNRLAQITCDGGGRHLSTTQKNINMHNAEDEIALSEKSLPEVMAKWFIDEDKFREQFFINTDPRGYALKLNITAVEFVRDYEEHLWANYQKENHVWVGYEPYLTEKDVDEKREQMTDLWWNAWVRIATALQEMQETPNVCNMRPEDYVSVLWSTYALNSSIHFERPLGYREFTHCFDGWLKFHKKFD